MRERGMPDFGRAGRSVMPADGRTRRPPALDRRRVLLAGAAAATLPFAALPFAAGPVAAASLGDVRFRASWDGKPVGEHRITFRTDGDLMTVDTHVDITLKVMIFKVFRLKHDAREVWRAGRLVSLTSETELDGEFRLVSGDAVENGFRIVGADGPYLAAPNLLTTNSLWDSRIVREATLIDVQHGGEVGLVARLLGSERVMTPRGEVQASRYQIITPHYAGSVFYDDDRRWVRALVELKGETLEYALAS